MQEYVSLPVNDGVKCVQPESIHGRKREILSFALDGRKSTRERDTGSS